MLLILGCVLKLCHEPGASILMTLTIVFFIGVILPLSFRDVYRQPAEKGYRLVVGLAFLCIAVILLSALFKIQHWTGALELIYIGIIAPFVVFLPTFLYYSSQSNQLKIGNMVLIYFFLAYLAIITASLSMNVSLKVVHDYAKSISGLSENVAYYQQQTLLALKSVKENDANALMEQKLQQQSESACHQIDVLQHGMLLHILDLNQLDTSSMLHASFLSDQSGLDQKVSVMVPVIASHLAKITAESGKYQQMIHPGKHFNPVYQKLLNNSLAQINPEALNGKRLYEIIYSLECLKSTICAVNLEAMVHLNKQRDRKRSSVK